MTIVAGIVVIVAIESIVKSTEKSADILGKSIEKSVDTIGKTVEKAIILSKPGSDEEKKNIELIESRSRAAAKGGTNGVKDALTPRIPFFWPW